MNHEFGLARGVDRHNGARANPGLVCRSDDTVFRIQQQRDGTPLRVAVRAEYARHFALEIKTQHQRAHHRAASGVLHGSRVHQCLLFARTQVGMAKYFHVTFVVQCLRQQRVGTTLQRRSGVDLHQHIAFFVQ